MRRRKHNFPSPRRGQSVQGHQSDDSFISTPFLEINRSSLSLPVFYRRSLPKKVKAVEKREEKQLLVVEHASEITEKEMVVSNEMVKNQEDEESQVLSGLEVKLRDVVLRVINPLPRQVVKTKGVKIREKVRPPLQLEEKKEDTRLNQTNVTGKIFSHGGDTGDLIYALAAIKIMGGGRLRLVKTKFVREPFFPAKVELLRPFLEAQPYVTGVEYSETHVGINLDAARRNYGLRLNLCDMVTTTFKLPRYPKKEPWLFCSDPNTVAPVVIARSPRYRNDRCQWKLIREKYHADAIFVGLPEEHSDWQKLFGEIKYWPTPGWWDLYRVIAGAKLFIGNQSAPMALALGLCVPQIIQEMSPQCPNCYFERPGVYYLRGGETKFPDF